MVWNDIAALPPMLHASTSATSFPLCILLGASFWSSFVPQHDFLPKEDHTTAYVMALCSPLCAERELLTGQVSSEVRTSLLWTKKRFLGSNQAPRREAPVVTLLTLCTGFDKDSQSLAVYPVIWPVGRTVQGFLTATSEGLVIGLQSSPQFFAFWFLLLIW